MPRVAKHVEVSPVGRLHVDGEEFPFYVSDEGFAVEYDHGVSYVTVRIIADAVTIHEDPRVERTV